jgi:hypothetical protein
MEGWVRDLIIAVAGSLIWAVLSAGSTFGVRLTKSSREYWRARRDKEKADWKSGDLIKRQRIFNGYLFTVLKYFMIGSISIAVSTAIGDLEVTDKTAPLSTIDYINLLFDGMGIVFYLITLSRIVVFTRLLAVE